MFNNSFRPLVGPPSGLLFRAGVFELGEGLLHDAYRCSRRGRLIKGAQRAKGGGCRLFCSGALTILLLVANRRVCHPDS